MLDGILDWQGHTTAECAQGCLLHRVEKVGEEFTVDFERGVATSFGDEFLAAGAAEAAGKAFAAAFVSGELEEVLDVFDHRHRLGDADDTGMAKEEAGFLEAFEIDGELGDVAHRNEAAERAADLDGLDLRFEAAREVDDSLQRCAHGDFVDAGLHEMGIEREELRACGLRGADLRIAFAAEREDGAEVGEGFDVVDDGGLAVEALIHRERRTRAHLGPQAFDAGQQRGFLAADVGSGTFNCLQSEVEAGAEDVLAEQACCMQVSDGLIHDGDAVRILGPDVEHARLRSGEPTGDHHAEQHAVRLLLHEVFVNVGTGIALVGIADDVFHFTLRRTATGPLDGQRETRTTTSTQAAVLQFSRECIAIAFGDELLEGRVVILDAFEIRGKNRGLQMRNDGVAVFAIPLAGLEKIAQSGVGLA